MMQKLSTTLNMVSELNDISRDFKVFGKNQLLTDSVDAFASSANTSISSGGRIIIASDGDYCSGQIAHHLTEEMRVRYKSGELFSRPDRHAILALEIPDARGSYYEKFAFNSDDSLVVFRGQNGNIPLPLVTKAEQVGIKILDVGAMINSVTANTQWQSQVSYIKQITNLALGEACLHAICEHFEPETPESTFKVILTAGEVLIATAEKIVAGELNDATSILRESVISGTPIFIIGNGGSACDAEIIANIWNSQLAASEKLSVLPHVEAPIKGGQITCAWNDNHTAFLRTVECFGSEKLPVIVLGLSTSGNSYNVQEALEHVTKSTHGVSIAFLGKDGGSILAQQSAPHTLVVPNNFTGYVQIAHVATASMMLNGI